MANPYPIRVQGSDGIATLNGEATFTDPANQPGGGGSQPVELTVTASEIAARWNNSDFFAAVAWPDFPDALLATCIEVENTLDQNCILGQLYSQAPGATSDDVYQSGGALCEAATPDPGTYQTGYASTILGNGRMTKLNVGAAAFVGVSGDAAPTTGSLTIRLVTYR